MSFYRERPIKAVRKARFCLACPAKIEVGEPALDCSGHWDGEFWSGTYHADCRAAEIAYNKLIDSAYDEWVNLSETSWEDMPWLIEEYPAVAARKGWTMEKYESIRDERERCRKAFAERAKG